MKCENCDRNVDVLYEVRRMRTILLGYISFRFGLKNIEVVCPDCIALSIILFCDKKHNVCVEEITGKQHSISSETKKLLRVINDAQK